MAEERDDLDGCGIDFSEFADDEETAMLRPLFPRGADDAHLAEEWHKVFAKKVTRPRSTARPRRAASGGFDTGIADRLRRRGLAVVEVAGWKTRGRPSLPAFSPRGSVDHHTAGPLAGNSPSLGICINGRPDLSGPLCHVLIARDNTCYVIAAGKANHAGAGQWGTLLGNSSVYGVEHENTGVGNEPWREDQRVTASKVHAALIDGVAKSDQVCEHKEWTPQKVDKWDQSGTDMRERVRQQLAGTGGDGPAPTQEWRKVIYVRGLTPEAALILSYPGLFGPTDKTAIVVLAPVQPFPDPMHYGPGSFAFGFKGPDGFKSYVANNRYDTLKLALHGEGVL